MWEHNRAGSCTRWRELWTFHSRRRPDNLVQSNSRLSGGVSGAINRATWASFRGVVDACPGKLREGKSFSSPQQHQSAVHTDRNSSRWVTHECTWNRSDRRVKIREKTIIHHHVYHYLTNVSWFSNILHFNTFSIRPQHSPRCRSASTIFFSSLGSNHSTWQPAKLHKNFSSNASIESMRGSRKSSSHTCWVGVCGKAQNFIVQLLLSIEVFFFAVSSLK